MSKKLFTSESVTEGHPDKICDQISDGILDEILKNDPMCRVACECLVTTGLVVVSGEISTKCYVDIQKIVRETIREIGYTRAKYGFDCDTCGVMVTLDEQSIDIARGVDLSIEGKDGDLDPNIAIGAGDQGIMFGYATDETIELMPLPITLAHKLAKRLSVIRKDGTLKYLRPDGKTQVTVEYEGDVPIRVDKVVISTQHEASISQENLKNDLIREVINKIIPSKFLDSKTKYYVNPTGRFVIGGPQSDTGLTGRKIIVDTYGGSASHGGGAFSGKDPTKVDRSACYAARYVAKNIVASKIAKRCEIQLSYAIGVSKPTSIFVNTFGTGKIDDIEIVDIINKEFDLSPSGIIENFQMRRPIFKQVAAYGHFGRNDLNLPWEKIDKVCDLKKYLDK